MQVLVSSTHNLTPLEKLWYAIPYYNFRSSCDNHLIVEALKEIEFRLQGPESRR